MTVIACSLPNGLQVDFAGVRVVLKGARAPDAVCGFGMTTVEDDWAHAWFTEGPGSTMQIAKIGGLFIAKDGRDGAAMANERRDELTGFEGLDPDKPAPGTEPTEDTKKELKKARATRATPGA